MPLTMLALMLTAAAVPSSVPRTWADSSVRTLEVPLASRHHSPVHVSEKAYYQIPERIIYRSYPVYFPGREPAGYQEWLAKQEPAIAFDPAKLKTTEDWIRAGKLVFNAPTSYNPVFFSARDLKDPSFYARAGMPVARDGTIPFARWVIRKKGVVELGSMGCNTCHTRVLPDGLVVPGAPGNNPNDREGAMLLEAAARFMDPQKVLMRIRLFVRQFEAPWIPDDPNRQAETLSLKEFIEAGKAIPPGVTARSNTSMFLPPQIPDLIGVRDRRYLDHTGLVQHRDIGDLMRYTSLSQDVFKLDRYPGVPPAPKSPEKVERYSDAQLYALALYVYSLQPPPNPNRFDAQAERGKKIFARERCGVCHTPPLYTNNRLAPVDGFHPSREDKQRFDILDVSVGTDPRYALETHKGTGYYKVPSLKGVWYRGPFQHNGAVATLEDWFDPARLGDQYVPTGFKGWNGKDRSVKGHPFGLDLSSGDRKALIAFLKTL